VTHEVLLRVSRKIQNDYPAEALHLIIAARDVQRMEAMLDAAVEDCRVIEFRRKEKCR
jgi:hypothetical protein